MLHSPPLTIKLQEIIKIIEKFKGEDKNKLSSFLLKESEFIFSNFNSFGPLKIQLLKLCLIYSNDKVYCKKAINNKILQTRALILDLVKSDYSLEQEYFYKPEKWMVLIVDDIRESFGLLRKGGELKGSESEIVSWKESEIVKRGRKEELGKGNGRKGSESESVRKGSEIGRKGNGQKGELGNGQKGELETNEQAASDTILEIYNELLLKNIRLIFCSQDKFRSGGNQLILNLLFYEKEIGRFVNFDFTKEIDFFKERFLEGKYLGTEKLRRILGEYSTGRGV